MSLPAKAPYIDYYVGEHLTRLSTPCHKAGFFSRGALARFHLEHGGEKWKSQQLSSL